MMTLDPYIEFHTNFYHIVFLQTITFVSNDVHMTNEAKRNTKPINGSEHNALVFANLTICGVNVFNVNVCEYLAGANASRFIRNRSFDISDDKTVVTKQFYNDRKAAHDGADTCYDIAHESHNYVYHFSLITQ
jgi:hypothetical protein